MSHYTNPNLHFLLMNVIPKDLKLDDVVFVCIGTDRSTGDSLGPMVGTYLERVGYSNVVGTLDAPCHAVNLHERLKRIPEGKMVIVIDACLGKDSSIGKIFIGEGGARPGAGVNRDLGVVGNYHILGCVNVGGFTEYSVLQNTRLSLVMNMADAIADVIRLVFPLTLAAQEAAATKIEEEN